jgi:hypothetical protein
MMARPGAHEYLLVPQLLLAGLDYSRVFFKAFLNSPQAMAPFEEFRK